MSKGPNLEDVCKTFNNVELDAFLTSLQYTDVDFKKHLEGKNPKRITFTALATNVILSDDVLRDVKLLFFF